MSALKNQITEDMKTAMRAKDSARLGAIRLILAALKQKEVDERVELTDTDVVAVLEKMLKQRKDSITQYEAANRQDLAEQEKFEVGILSAYMPQPLTEAEIAALIDAAIVNAGVTGMAAMGKVMAELRPKIAGRADAAAVSAKVKAKLAG